MAPLAAPTAFVLSTRWVVTATSSGVPAKMTFVTFVDRINLVV